MPPWAGPTRWGICSAGKISHDFIIALKTLSAQEHTCPPTVAALLAPPQHSIPQSHTPSTAPSPTAVPTATPILHSTAHPPHNAAPSTCPRTTPHSTAPLFCSHCPQAFWTRFFPVSGRIQTLLAQGALGQVKVVRAAVAFHMSNVPRLVEKDLGGGALLDLGCYCVQFACMVFGGEKPQSILASGFLHETGVDETTSIILNYSRKRQAVLTCSFVVNLPNQATISGCITQGEPTAMLFNGERWECPLPPPSQPLNFERGTGLRYEAQHVRECLLQGLKESPIMSLADSELVASILDEARKQLGVKYTQDQCN
uniref:Dihydrodiol dehydrogenase n=1 Tax=Crocodylus porosus TaxID=8502 RepID=A0A7M4FFE9_CROPO